MEPIKSLLGSSKPKANPHLHSSNHALADQLCQLTGHRYAFPIFLGLAKRYSATVLLSTAREVVESNVEFKGRIKLFLWKLNH